MNKIKKIYIASPYGFSEAGRMFLYEKLIPAIEECGLTCIDPWKLTPENLIVDVLNITDPVIKKTGWAELNKIIAGNNSKAIGLSDGMLAVLDGTDVDSGTAAEIGFAAALNKKICGYRGDFRMSGDNEGSVVNLQVEYFILNSGGNIVFNLIDLKTEIKRLFSV
jgi:nucleoside 2-deoxyribosyltransferase